MPTLTFDVRYDDGSGNGVQVDSTISVNIYEDLETLKTTRVKGTDATTSIVEVQDANGYLYRTIVNLTGYVIGPVKAVWTAALNSNPIPEFTETIDWPGAEDFSGTSVKQYVLGMLGHPTVQIELTSGQVQEIAKTALRTYNRLVGRLRKGVIELVQGVATYSAEVASPRGVVKCEFTRKHGTPLISDPLFGREYPRGSGSIDYDQYVLGDAHWKQVLRTASQEPEWDYDSVLKKVLINVGSNEIVQSGMWNVNYWYYENVAIQDIPEQHKQVFLDLCLGLSMQVLSRVRGKYGGSVLAPGSPVTLDAASMMQDGTERVRDAETKLQAIGSSEIVPEYG